MSVARNFIKSLKEVGFHETMESLGFSLASDYPMFYRFRGELIDCIVLQPVASGMGVMLHTSVVKLEMYPDYDAATFPKGFSKYFRNIANKFISEDGIGFDTGDWDTSGVGRFEKTFKEISSLLNSDVLPWFEEINSNQKLYESIFEDYQEDYDYLLK